MVQKKTGVLIILLTILCLGAVSAEVCTIQSSCDPDYTIMKLSGATNAHGELWDQTAYNYFLCCDFQKTHVCDGANKIIGLSDITNAHAEIPSLDNYATDVCYGDFVCRGATGTCNFGEMELMSLSADTNAHIGAFADYTTKICCSGICESGYEYVAGNCEIEQVAYWANLGGQFIDHSDVNPGNTIISLILENARLAQGTEVNFDIYEDDPVNDDEIRTITGIVDDQGKAVVKWLITQEDIDTAQGLFNEPIEDLEFYFDVATSPVESSGSLKITVVVCNDIYYCMDYFTEGECISDACMAAETSVQVNNPFITCGTGFNCFCAWRDGECGPAWTALSPICGNGQVNTGETCDGSDWGSIAGCTDFDEFTGGNLLCGTDCHFDTSSCTGGNGPGPCGNNVVNTGETCDGSDWGSTITSCINFDNFNGGTLTCRSDCRFDTSSCTGGIYGVGRAIGTCFFNEDTADNCDDGFLTYSWAGSWVWGVDNIFSSNPDGEDYIENPVGSWHFDSERIYLRCIGDSNTIACPAQIQLPFFTWQTLLATLIILGAIYFTWSMRKKKTRKKSKSLKKKK